MGETLKHHGGNREIVQLALHTQRLNKEAGRRKDRQVDFIPETELSLTELCLKTDTMAANNVLLNMCIAPFYHLSPEQVIFQC